MSHAVSQLLKRLFRNNHKAILFTYGLTFLENLFELLYPLAIGFAIDGLLKSKYVSLIPFLCIWLSHAITAIFRHIYDTKTFTNIYTNLATTLVLEQNKHQVPTGQIIARSALSREFVNFFEHNIPQIMTALFSFIGALLMLFVYDIQIGFYCLILLIPLVLINRTYARRAKKMNLNLNNLLEQEAETLSRCGAEDVRSHYTRLAKWRIRLSNAEAINYGLMEVFAIALMATVLIRTIWIPGIQAGTIFAIVSYLLNFLESLDDVPRLVQEFSRLNDIGERFQLSMATLNDL